MQAKRECIRVARVREHPDHWVLTKVDADGLDLWRVLRKPDGTFWQVAATHILPPTGGLVQFELGDEIKDAKIIRDLESVYVKAEEESPKQASKS